VVVVGCASANIGAGGNADGNTGSGDGSGDPPIDAPDAPPPIDAALTSVTMNESGSSAVTATQIACQQTNPLTNFTTENSYYRIFPLADFGITTPLHVTDVTFAVERATAGNGVSQPAQVKLGTYTGVLNAGSFPVSQITPLASATIQIPQGATSVTTPISAFSPTSLTIPPGTLLAAEVFIPDGRPAGNIFYMGSNAGTETHPSYIRAQDCSVLSPATFDSVVGTAPAIRLLLTVSGTY
jgi:hypothetical protein